MKTKSDDESIHPVDCRCERKKCKQDRKWRSTGRFFRLEVVARSCDSTISGQIGPGRLLDKACGKLGRIFNRTVDHVAVRLGKGPLAAERRLRRHAYGPDDGELQEMVLKPGFGTNEDVERAHEQLNRCNVL